MTSDTSEITPERLAAVEAELARVRQVQERDSAERANRDELLAKPRAPQSRGWKKDLADLEEQARRVRIDAHAEAGRLYTAQLERTRPAREKMEAELARLAERAREESDRHAREISAIGDERSKIRAKLDGLLVPAVTMDELLATSERSRALAAIAEQRLTVLTPAGREFRPGVPLELTRQYAGVNQG